MQVCCPSCGAQILPDDVNVSTDVAYCRQCNETFALSELSGAIEAANASFGDPPKGAWYREFPDGFEVGASTKSWLALLLVPFMCVWSGVSLGGIYGSQIASGHFSLGLSLFGLPFLAGAFFFGSIALLMLCGKVVVTVDRGRACVFTGIGSVGWSRHFDWSDVQSVQEEAIRGSEGGTCYRVSLQGKRRITVSGFLRNEERRYFLVNVLRAKLAKASARR